MVDNMQNQDMKDEIEIAFVGTGMMGAPMARRLCGSPFTIRVWNRTLQKALPLVEAGALLASDVAEAAAGADFVCLCLTDAEAVETALFGPPGLARALEPGMIVIDFSTIGPSATRDFASRIPATWLDCPVSGGVQGAQAGTLSIFAGGDPAAIERARPVLDRVGSRLTLMGPAGAGQAAKLCNQLLVSTQLVAIAEAMALAHHFRLRCEALPDALQGGFADSPLLRFFGPRMALAGIDGPPSGALETMAKDVALIQAEAASRKMPLPLLEGVDRLYRAGIARDLGSEPLEALARLYREEMIDVAIR